MDMCTRVEAADTCAHHPVAPRSLVAPHHSNGISILCSTGPCLDLIGVIGVIAGRRALSFEVVAGAGAAAFALHTWLECDILIVLSSRRFGHWQLDRRARAEQRTA